MSVDIVHRDTGAMLYQSETADTVAKAVSEAIEQGANLQGANLRGANLWGADLQDANGIIPAHVCHLLMLRDQPGDIIAYKLVTADGDSPIQDTGKIRYEMGWRLSVPDANTNPAILCAEGINVATSPWICANYQPGYRILKVQFRAADIACIPTASDGKFRLHRCTVVGEIDPKGWGRA